MPRQQEDRRWVLESREIDGVRYDEIINFDDELYPCCKIFCDGKVVEDEILWINIITGEYECLVKQKCITKDGKEEMSAFWNPSKQKIETAYKKLDPTNLKLEWEGGVDAYFKLGWRDWVQATAAWRKHQPKLVNGKVVWPGKDLSNAS